MRVLFVGDVHANSNFIKRVYAHAEDQAAEAIVQVGDFGWWPRNPQGKNFIAGVSKLATETDIPLIFVDGNHEDHDQLPHDADELVELKPGLYYLPRGVVIPLGDARVLGIGGAVSVDKQWRTEHVDWFRDEVPNFSQFHRALTAEGPIDVIVAHDLPTGMELDLTFPVDDNTAAYCQSHRDGMLEILQEHQPVLWVGGHYHQRVSQEVEGTRVECLAHEDVGLGTWLEVLDFS